MTGHETVIQYLSDRWLWVVFWVWVFGGFTWAGDHWRQVRKRARKAAEVRHRRRLELELARAGRPYRGPRPEPAGAGALPAAVIPAPPGAQPVSGVPGACRHEKIVPVIGGDGELHKWICASPRCDAEFDRSVAVYDDQA